MISSTGKKDDLLEESFSIILITFVLIVYEPKLTNHYVSNDHVYVLGNMNIIAIDTKQSSNP